MAIARIYVDMPTPAIGGLENIAVVLAGELRQRYTVEILHHKPQLERARLEQAFGCDLSDVTLRFVPHHDYAPEGLNPVTRLAAARAWQRDLSDGADVFVCIGHGLPPFCHARVGVLVIAFPFYIRPSRSRTHEAHALKATLGLVYERAEWRKRISGYQVISSISEFTRHWTQQFWGVDSIILSPPIDLCAVGDRRSDSIVSVGRFSGGRHSKRQREMMEAYGKSTLAGRWRYLTAGIVGNNAEDLAYAASVDEIATRAGGTVVRNIARADLCRLYGEAKIFWHAAGFGEDPDAHPHLLEHFGITTVEAMSAGCVPVVIRRGGQPEIVEHGVSGFVWDTLDELIEYSERLAASPDLWRRMSAAACLRAQLYSRAAVIARFRAELLKLGVALT